jgi:hypothetical protein
VPGVTEIDRALDAVARAAIDGLIVMPDLAALTEEGDSSQHIHNLYFWRGKR